MKKLTYAEHCRLAYLFGFKPRNPISFLIWKIKRKRSKDYRLSCVKRASYKKEYQHNVK